MTTRRSAARKVGYQIFYRLPRRLRRRLVRLFVPSYIVGAVVLVWDPQGRLLLLRQPPGIGWTIPGGLLNRGEQPLDCAVRELAEETGIKLSPDALRQAVPNAVIHTRGRWVDVVFEATVDPAQHNIQVDGAEVWETGWFAPDTLPQLTRPTARLLARYGLGPLAGKMG